MKLPWARFAAITAVVAVLDQITKYWAVGALTNAFDGRSALGAFLWHRHPAGREVVVVIDGFWRFRYAENPGAAWSFLANTPSWFNTPFFLSISVVAGVAIIMFFRGTTSKQWLLRTALALVFGGAVGNFLDRVRLGYVIDFIEWHYHNVSWPIFNVADSAISVGVVLILLEMFFNPTTKPEEQ